MRALILLFAISAPAAEPFDVRSPAHDPRVMAVMQDLAARGERQIEQREIAAFLVRDANGAISSVLWPRTWNSRSERYDGVIPPGTVAIAHTHPSRADKRPSRGDIEQAVRIGLPIYVITRWHLYVVDSSGVVIRLYVREDWSHRREVGILP